jgi:hypothetical protein
MVGRGAKAESRGVAAISPSSSFAEGGSRDDLSRCGSAHGKALPARTIRHRGAGVGVARAPCGVAESW